MQPVIHHQSEPAKFRESRKSLSAAGLLARRGIDNTQLAFLRAVILGVPIGEAAHRYLNADLGLREAQEGLRFLRAELMAAARRAGAFGAEPWTEEMRGRIEELLGIDALDIYGLTEICGPGVAYECLEKKGMHVNEDHIIPEIIDPDTGAVLPDGAEGELVFTTLTKQALPMIRYRTRDLTRLLPPTARSFRRMGKIVGRSDDMLIIRGVNMFPTPVSYTHLTLPTIYSV